MAEEYFSRLRRAEIGIHHHITGSYLLQYAQEPSWREGIRRVSNGDQVNRDHCADLLVRCFFLHRLDGVGLTGSCGNPIFLVRPSQYDLERIIRQWPL